MLERRQSKRYPLSLPAEVRWRARDKGVNKARGETGDISSSGLMLVLPKALPLGTTINVTIHLPVELTKVPIELSCMGRVVRKSRMEKGQGISAVIEDFQLKPSRRRAAKA
jgi:c-di-GMP-binding flagellar brake protein YcgR